MREMKDSGIEWIGEIPVDWELNKIGSLYDERRTKVSDKDYQPLSVTKQGIVPQLETAAKTDNGDNRKLIKKNDFVINSRSDRRGSCGISEYDGSCSLINTVLKPRKNMCNAYYSFVFRSERFADEFYRWGTGIVDDLWSTKWSNMKNIYIPFPTLEEQYRISAYLDDKCTKIDSIIEKQEKVIEKLKDYKLSVITEAVTKGLNPDVKMKDSGVAWIGEIPEHWSVGKVGYFTTKIGSGKTPKGGAEVYSQAGILFIRSQNVYDDGLKMEESTYIDEEIDEEMFGTRVYKDDVLLNITGGSIGRSCIYQLYNHANVNQHVCIIRTIKTMIIPKFMHYFWISNLGHTSIAIHQTGANREGMNFEQISKTLIPIMSVKEQEDICNYLDKKCSAIDSAIEKKQAIIEKLKEYKKSLIYEVVTGKREVFSEKKSVAVICPVGIPTNEEEYAKILLMQKIIIRCGKKLKGRTHLMKIFHALELEIGFSFHSEYTRHYHGPYDKKIEKYEKALERKGWIKLKKEGNMKYIVVNPTAYKTDYNRIFAEYNKEIERIIDFFKKMTRTSKAEKVATLLASWNDFLIDGIAEPTDDMIITDVMTNWTENKRNIDYETWQEVLDRMKKANIVPHGYGKHTIRMED